MLQECSPTRFTDAVTDDERKCASINLAARILS